MPHNAPRSCRRLGSEACRAKVTLEVNWQPQRFKLSPALGSLLGVQSDTRARVLQVRHEECCDTTVRCTQCTVWSAADPASPNH
jgi:hypothetical protein